MTEIDAVALRDAANRYLAGCFAEPAVPRAGELAAVLSCSASTLSRIFLRETGTLPSHYLRSGQLAYAKALLIETDLPVRVVAFRAGYGTTRAFHRTFRSLMSTTPSSYRRGERNVSRQS